MGNTGWNGYEIRVSTESRPCRRKFSRRSCRDSNPRLFSHEPGALWLLGALCGLSLAHLFSIFCFSIFLSFATTLPTKASFLLYFSFSLLFTLLSLFLTIPGIEEGTGDQCETVRNCTWRPRLAHLFSVHFHGPSPILLSLSFSFPGIEEGTCRFKLADSRTGSADVLALSTFSLFLVLLSSPFLPTLLHLRFSSTQLENRLLCCCFFTVFFISCCWGLVVSNDLGGDNVWLLD